MEEIAARDAGAEESAGDDVVALIAAGLDADEAAANAAAATAPAPWSSASHESDYRMVKDGNGDPVVYYEGTPTLEEAAHIARHDPGRALREVTAKRSIIGEQTSDHAPVESVYGLVCRTCVDWQDAPWAEGGETEFGIAIPQAWPCGVARAVAASWPGRAEQKP